MLEPFDCYSPGSRRLYTFQAHDEQPLLIAELRRTGPLVAAAAADRAAKGLLAGGEADRVAATWAAIVEDLEAEQCSICNGGMATLDDTLRNLRAASGISWERKIVALRREIEARRAAYPADVAKGRLTAADAQQRLERLEAVHDFYWRTGFAFDGTRDELRAITRPILDSREFTAPAEAA